MPYSSASLRVQRIVIGKGVAPHGGPQIVALHAKDQLEHLLVDEVVHAAELLACPAGERRRFVVDEDAAVLHGGLALGVHAGRDEQLRLMRRRHVGPPVPGRYADLRRHVVHTVDRAALVAAGNHERAVHPGHGLLDRLHDERFPLSGDRRRVDLLLARQPVDDWAFAQRADNHHLLARW